MKRRDYTNIIILLIIGLLVVGGIYFLGNIFGANMDWINQHTVIPEYFRQYFYQTKKLIPDIIYNLGLGQNAFNFSYYGLLNPIILISYFLPFINMTNYIIGSSIILYLLSILLIYRFFRDKFNSKLTILLTLVFMSAAPVLFHFHRQIMFVNYLPFLIMALINIDNYDKRSSKIFLIINILCMILTSFYFSVGGILVILIYYIHLNIKSNFKEKIKIFIPIIISVLLAGILLIPSLYAIINNRGTINENINLLSLFIPNFSNVLYGSYALGLLSIAIISILWSVIKSNSKSKFLGISLLIIIAFPFIRYILNGGLYVRSKSLIPFLPIIILMLGYFLDDMFNNKVEIKKLFIGIVVLSILGLFNFNIAYYLDLLGTTICLLIYFKVNKKFIVIVPVIASSLVVLVVSNINENYITMGEYKDLEKNSTIINSIIENDNSFYRISELDNTLYNVNRNYSFNHLKTSIYSSVTNNYYKNFYYDILKVNNNNYNNLIIRDSDNLILNRLLGVKYVISDKTLGYGYSKISPNVYKNDLALSLGYASSTIYSLNSFNNLPYPYNLKYLLNGIVVDSYSKQDTPDLIEEYKFDLINEINKRLPPSHTGNKYTLTVLEKTDITIPLDDILTDKLLFIVVNGLESNSCANEDIKITINGQENSLSCSSWLYHNQNYSFHYLINEKDLSHLNISIDKGTYKINDIELYTIDVENLQNNFDEMVNIEINDNVITGSINITNDGYMTLSIPYDENFTIYVDEKEVQYEKVNTAFLGFKIDNGTHDVKIIYYPKGLKLGKVASTLGLLLLAIYFLFLLKKGSKFDKMKLVMKK